MTAGRISTSAAADGVGSNFLDTSVGVMVIFSNLCADRFDSMLVRRVVPVRSSRHLTALPV